MELKLLQCVYQKCEQEHRLMKLRSKMQLQWLEETLILLHYSWTTHLQKTIVTICPYIKRRDGVEAVALYMPEVKIRTSFN